MSIFTDFDASYSGEFVSGIPSGDGSIDIFSGSTVVDKISPAADGFVDGDWVFHSANAEGGMDTFVNGKLTTHTQENILGGENIYEGTNLTHTTIPNVQGGVDIYGEDFQLEGTTSPNVFGGEDYLSTHGNTQDILSYDDPLKYVQNLHFDPFDVQSIA